MRRFLPELRRAAVLGILLCNAAPAMWAAEAAVNPDHADDAFALNGDGLQRWA